VSTARRRVRFVLADDHPRNVTLRRGTKVVLDNASSPSTPAKGRPGRPQRRRQVHPVRPAQRQLHEDGGDFHIPPVAHGQVAQDMPETDQSATDFVLEGDTRLPKCSASWQPPRPATTAWPWPRPTPTCTTPAPTTPARAQA
jgi:hypothetical protein